MNHVLDAGATIAYLRAEQGGEVVRELLADSGHQCSANAVNATEVFYNFLRAADEPTADAAIATLLSDGVSIREDMDTSFWKDVGRLKGAHGIALVDTFGLALARRLACDFVTTDHGELDGIAPLGVCAITFIR